MSQNCVALLGRRDEPTDAVEDYCRFLGASLLDHDIHLEIMRVEWAETGWRNALRKLKKVAESRRNTWFLLQYTALAWSRRGFSWRFLSVIRQLRKDGIRCAIVFHDAEAYAGDRLIDRIRHAVQLFIMRNAARLAHVTIFTIPPETIRWVAGQRLKTAFIPIGANLPSPERAWVKATARPPAAPTVGVFSLSGGHVGVGEIKLIAEAAQYVCDRLGKFRLVILGRNSALAQNLLTEPLQGKPVELVIRGMLPAEQVVDELGGCDAMLFVRGPLSSGRGSAIAGIACGLPVIAREGWETAGPIREAGVVLVPRDATDEFGPALLRVLTDKTYRDALAERSRRAQTEHFSWRAIAAKYAEAFTEGSG